MISKMTQALILTGALLTAGAASASEGDVIVPALAGAAVGAVLVTLISNSGNDQPHHSRDRGHAPPRFQPRYQPVAYVPVRPPAPHGHYARGHDRGHDSRHDRGDPHGRRGGHR